jgi:streptogramin lyase
MATDAFGWARTQTRKVFFQTDMNSKLIRHLQIPLGPSDNGGRCHGAKWHDGKIWIVANRLRGILRVDPKTWQPEFLIPIYTTGELPRWHDVTFDNEGFLWQINGNDSTSFAEGRPGLIKYRAVQISGWTGLLDDVIC